MQYGRKLTRSEIRQPLSLVGAFYPHEARKAENLASSMHAPSASCTPALSLGAVRSLRLPIHNRKSCRAGAPISDAVRVFDGFAAAYDFRTRNPKWVLEHITAEGLNGDATRYASCQAALSTHFGQVIAKGQHFFLQQLNKSEFFEDPGVDERFRAKLSDFRDSGYDRGHMAPAADLKSSQKAMDESFNLVNISPQIGAGFNRDYWSRFERYIRSLVHKSDGGVYIVTGPLWLPKQDANGNWAMQHPMIGKPPSLVAVPTHYFKVRNLTACLSSCA
eukprot:353839-Chlamydomonas_euryale.AAC.39